MNGGEPDRGPNGGWIEAVSRLCPPNGRRWVQALCAESAEVPGWRARCGWLIGVGGIVLVVAKANASLVVSPLIVALGTGIFLASVGFTSVAVIGIELASIDDDAFLTAALVADFLFLAGALLVVWRIYRHPRALSRT